jgi:hypothetical protein
VGKFGALYWFEWLGLALIALGLFLMFRGDSVPNTQTGQGAPFLPAHGLWIIFLQIVGATIGVLGLLLLLVRVFIGIRWWYSWLPIGAIGLFAYAIQDQLCEACCHPMVEECE